MPSIGLGFNLFNQIHELNDKCVYNPGSPKDFVTNTIPLFVSWSTVVVVEDDNLICRGFLSNEIPSKATSVVLQNKKLFYVEKKKLYCAKLKTNAQEKKQISCEKDEDIQEIFGNFNGTIIYAIGGNGNMWGIDNETLPIPMPINNQIKISKLSCGNNHTLALTSEAQVLAWGVGSRGQLGHGSLQDSQDPRIVDVLLGLSIKLVKAGGWHSVVLSETGDLYVFGWNNNGQLGYEKVVTMLSNPSLLELEKYMNMEKDYATFSSVDCGMLHTAASTVEGQLVTWGNGKYGQLGRSQCDNDFNLPKRSDFLSSKYKVCQVKCGPWNTFIKY